MLASIKHFLIPHHTNNHRAKLLHNSTLIVIILAFLLVSLFANVIKSTHPSILGVSYSISEGELINLVNQQRQSQGLSALTQSAELDDAARRKAADMFSKNYWAHFSPDGTTSPWTFIKDSGYAYTFAGENLAKGFSDSPSVVSAWMGSPTHRENILSDKYREVGFAIVPGTLEGEETVLIVQMFGARTSETLAQEIPAQSKTTVEAPSEVEVAAAVSTPSPTPVVAAKVASVATKPAVDVKSTTKAISTAGLAFLAIVLVLDVVIVEKRKIPRLVGHNLDHIMLIILFLLFVVLTKGGATL